MALNAAVVWEVQTGGSDNNGGGFKTGATGTDRSQQTAAQVAIDNAAITTSITTKVITFTGGYSPSAADVGNVVQMLTGTNVTAGFYEITSVVAGTSWTVDRNVVSSGTTTNATGNMGGCLGSPGKAAGALIAGNKVWLKAGTHGVTSASTNVAGGCLAPLASAWEGYQTTRGDLGTAPLLQASGISSFTMAASGSGYSWRNLTFDGATLTSSRGFNVTDGRGQFYKVTAKNCTNSGFNGQGQYAACAATGCTTAGGGFNGSGTLAIYFGCESYGNSVPGFNIAGSAVLSFCISSGNTGGSTDGFTLAASGAVMQATNCIAYGNGRTGFNVTVASTTTLANCIAEGNGAYGFSPTAGSYQQLINCAGYNNSSGNINGSFNFSYGFVTGSASFFTNAASGDFSLNTTAGGGASVRAAGYPGVFPRGLTTGYLDIGAVQHADPAALRFNLFASPIVRVVEPS